MKEKLSLHIPKRSEHVLQWSKTNFFTFFLTSLLASFFNATRTKLVTLDFSVKKKAYGIESIHSMITGTLFHFNSTNFCLSRS